MNVSAKGIVSIASAGVLAAVIAVLPANAAVPNTDKSYYVPQVGPVATPTEGMAAVQLFRMCPNNDGGSSLPNSARIKVVVQDGSGHGITGIAAADIVVLFNGGTPAQSFSGVGADSIVSNSQFNPSPLCPDVRTVDADAPTDGTGTTYITFTGADPASPGVGLAYPANNRNRKWGHYDTELPVYVLGFKLSGRLTTESANGTYALRIKSMDWTGGLGTTLNQGEAVTVADFNGIANGIGITNAISYWKDFDSLSGVTATDLNIITSHLNHDCDTPTNP
jgi:hypothetical protein